MTKKFFTKVSPKAAKGIVRVYESKGYDVHAKPQSNGDFVVVVVQPDGEFGARRKAVASHHARKGVAA